MFTSAATNQKLSPGEQTYLEQEVLKKTLRYREDESFWKVVNKNETLTMYKCQGGHYCFSAIDLAQHNNSVIVPTHKMTWKLSKPVKLSDLYNSVTFVHKTEKSVTKCRRVVTFVKEFTVIHDITHEYTNKLLRELLHTVQDEYELIDLERRPIRPMNAVPVDTNKEEQVAKHRAAVAKLEQEEKKSKPEKLKKAKEYIMKMLDAPARPVPAGRLGSFKDPLLFLHMPVILTEQEKKQLYNECLQERSSK